MSEPMKVDVWSDVQCPWCYIGKRKFERGVELFGEPVEVEFHSYQLAPDSPVDFDGSHLDYLATKFAMPESQVEEMLSNVSAIAAEVGLAYDFDSVQQTNTTRAHEVLHLAKQRGLQDAVNERLMRAYFIEGRHIGHIDDLVELGSDVGLDPVEVRDALDDGRYADAVEADIAQAQAYGITGVPFFVIDGKLGVPGAQSPEVFASALEQARDSDPTR
ncbi:MAG: DsbA family oxidoreductase [Actinobacteria bacterium]|nr:DsbA family oxidoreductase [Actinomycetota bacterium]